MTVCSFPTYHFHLEHFGADFTEQLEQIFKKGDGVYEKLKWEILQEHPVDELIRCQGSSWQWQTEAMWTNCCNSNVYVLLNRNVIPVVQAVMKSVKFLFRSSISFEIGVSLLYLAFFRIS